MSPPPRKPISANKFRQVNSKLGADSFLGVKTVSKLIFDSTKMGSRKVDLECPVWGAYIKLMPPYRISARFIPFNVGKPTRPLEPNISANNTLRYRADLIILVPFCNGVLVSIAELVNQILFPLAESWRPLNPNPPPKKRGNWKLARHCRSA